MRRILLSAAIVLAAGAFLIIAGGSSNGPTGATYKVEFDNAFGLVNGADFKVAGVRAGSIKSIDDEAATYIAGLAGTEYGKTPIRALLHM